MEHLDKKSRHGVYVGGMCFHSLVHRFVCIKIDTKKKIGTERVGGGRESYILCLVLYGAVYLEMDMNNSANEQFERLHTRVVRDKSPPLQIL